MAEVIRKNLNVQTTVMATGYGTNIALLGSGEAQMGMVWPYITTLALNGEGPYQGKDVGVQNLRVMSAGQTFPAGILVRADSPYKTISDLKGKRILVDRPVSPDTAAAVKVVLEAAGLKDGDYVNLSYEGFSDAAPALAQGTADAFGHWIDPSSAGVQELAETVGIRVLGLTAEQQEWAIQNYNWLFKASIPGGSIKGNDQETLMLGARAMMAASKDVPDSLAYEITKALFSNREALGQFHVRAPDWADPATAVSIQGILPYHPGAVRYYKEAGLWSDAMDATQQQLMDKYNK